MGIPVGSRFGQIVGKIHDRKILFRNRVYQLCKSVPYTEKSLKLVSKKALKKWNTNIFRFEHSDRENKTTSSDVPLLKEMFPLKRPKKSRSINSPTGVSETTILNSKRQVKGKRGHVVKASWSVVITTTAVLLYAITSPHTLMIFWHSSRGSPTKLVPLTERIWSPTLSLPDLAAGPSFARWAIMAQGIMDPQPDSTIITPRCSWGFLLTITYKK